MLIDLNGQRTSRFDRRTVEDQLTGLKRPGQRFELEPVDLLPMPGLNGASFSRLSAGISNTGLTLVVTLKLAGGAYQALAKPVGEPEAWEAFAGLLERYFG